MATYSADERFEEAAALRDRLTALVRGASRAQRLAPLASSPELVAARRAPTGGWEVVCVRHGRLAGTTITPRGADPLPHIEALRLAAEAVQRPEDGSGAASVEEMELVLRWLEADGVRLVDLDGIWSCPLRGAQREQDLLDPGLRRTFVEEDQAWSPPPRRASPVGGQD